MLTESINRLSISKETTEHDVNIHIKWINDCRTEYTTRCLNAANPDELTAIQNMWISSGMPPMVKRQNAIAIRNQIL